MPSDLPGKGLEPSRPRQMVHLSRRLRWTSALIGTEMAVFAAFAVWRGTDGAATTAFVAAAALFMLLAIAGVIPSRIKSGDHEIEMVEDMSALDSTMSKLSSRDLEDVIREIGITEYQDGHPSSESRVASRAAQHLVFEHDARNVLEGVAETSAIEINFADRRIALDHGFEAEALVDGSVKVVIETVFSVHQYMLLEMCERAAGYGYNVMVITYLPNYVEFSRPLVESTLGRQRLMLCSVNAQLISEGLNKLAGLQKDMTVSAGATFIEVYGSPRERSHRLS